MKVFEFETAKGNGNTVTAEVNYDKMFSGHGHYKIICHVDFNGHKKDFTHTTHDMPWIDQLSDLQSENPSWEDITDFYHSRFAYTFNEEITEWMDECNELEEQD